MGLEVRQIMRLFLRAILCVTKESVLTLVLYCAVRRPTFGRYNTFALSKFFVLLKDGFCHTGNSVLLKQGCMKISQLSPFQLCIQEEFWLMNFPRYLNVYICFTTCLVPSKALADRFHFSAGGFTRVGYARWMKRSTNIGDFGGIYIQTQLVAICPKKHPGCPL